MKNTMENPKIIKHSIIRISDDIVWNAIIQYDKSKYNIDIVANRTYNNEFYYTGYLIGDIFKKNRRDFVDFGYSDYKNTYRYILEAIIRVIKGDYSEIKENGFLYS